MSFKMDVDEVVAALVETMLPRASDPKKFLYIPLEVEAAKEDDVESYHRRFIHLLFQRPNNHTRVLWNVTTVPYMRRNELKGWKVTSDHNSRWKEEGVSIPLYKLYFEMCDEVDSSVKPKDLRTMARFSTFQKPEVVMAIDATYYRDTHFFCVQWE